MTYLRGLDRTLLVVAVAVGLAGCSRKKAPPADQAGSVPPAGANTNAAAEEPSPTPAPSAAATALPTIQPADLAAELKAGDKPLLLHVGFHTLYEQAHIPGSEYVGPTSQDAGIQHLRQRVASLPKDTSIVIYCGCCPWSHCPNVKPAAKLLEQMGFTNARVLYIGHNFGADWADHGYPITSGS